ncbi:MAG: alpha/beta fold hydrolase [Nitrospirae bacterium]|nr:alpha/beta fold hydrolase [Nitrospirota bacterium]
MKKTLSIALIVCLILGCTGFFFQPSKEFIENPYLKGISSEDVYFKTPDGLTLHSWLLMPEGKSEGFILYLHGNAENISTQIGNVLWLVREGFTVFAFDYRGYGKSEGSPEIKGLHIDAMTALEKAVSLTNEEDVIVLGQSLGGAISVYTVANSPFLKNVRAVVIDSAFSSYRAIAKEKASELALTWPFQHIVALSVNDDYSPVRWIDKLSPVPLLIIHGKKDPVVPLKHSLILFEKAGEPKDLWITESDGHIMSFLEKPIRKRLTDYLRLR